MPSLWDETIEAHHDAVTRAIFAAAGRIVARAGVAGLSMAALASEAGIGRATLYKYFGDLDALLAAWHRDAVEAHLKLLSDVRAAASRDNALPAVLAAYATIQRRHGRHDGAAALHLMPHVSGAQQRLQHFLTALIAESADGGAVRNDVAPAELARFAIAALQGASGQSKAASDRLVALVLATLAPGAR